MASKWEQVKKLVNSNEVKPWDFLNPNTEYASEEDSSFRYSLCQACPKFNNGVKTCQECGCFMPAKTKLQGATCPIGKW
jgi:hypothetical protein